MTSQLKNTDEFVKDLEPLFIRAINGEVVSRTEKQTEACKKLFSQNVLFLRTYLGFISKGSSFDQDRFAELIDVSKPGLRRWEGGQVIPNKLSLRSLSQFINEILKTPVRIENAHLLYRNLLNDIALLRMGIDSSAYDRLTDKKQIQFASLVNNHLDKVLEHFIHEAQEAQINYQILLDNALVGVYVMNNEGKIIYQNSALCEISNYTQQEIDEMGFEPIIHPDDLEDSKRRVKERLSGKIPREQYTFRINHKEKGYRTVEVHSSQIQIEGKSAILGVLHDITERLENEKLLRESEQRYRSLFTSMFTAFALHEVITDDKGKPVNYRFLDVNPAFEKMTGLKAKDIIGNTVLDILPKTESYWIQRFGNVALTGKPDHITEYSIEFDRYFEVHGYSPIHGQFAVNFVDVTEKVKSQQEASKLKFMVDNTETMILLSNLGKRDLLYVNDALCRELGYTKEELLTMKIGDIDEVYANIRDGVLEELHSRGKSSFNSELQRKDGSIIPVQINVSMIEYENEQLVFANITAL